MIGKEAIAGSLSRISSKVYCHDNNEWDNWPDWNHDSDFSDWENDGGNPPDWDHTA